MIDIKKSFRNYITVQHFSYNAAMIPQQIVTAKNIKFIEYI